MPNSTGTPTFQPPLIRVRDTKTVVTVGLGDKVTSDAGWATDDGYAVHRAHDAQWDTHVYWLRCTEGRWSRLLSLKEAVDSIAFLRNRALSNAA